MPKKISYDKDAAVQEYVAGSTLRQLSEKYGVCQTVIYYELVRRGVPRRYKSEGRKWKLNSEQLERKSLRQSGEGNNNYKTGRMRGGQGYILVGGRKRLREHRVVMEKMIGRELKGSELVHHWDKNPSNNAESNLCLMRCQEAHSRLHRFSDRHKIPMEDLKFEQTWLTP